MRQYSASKHSGAFINNQNKELNIKERGCEGEISIQVAVVSIVTKFSSTRRQIIS
jgi:hypothetical protein